MKMEICSIFWSNPILLNVCFPVQWAHRNFVLQPLNNATIMPLWCKFWNKWDLYLYRILEYGFLKKWFQKRVVYRYKSHLFQNLNHGGKIDAIFKGCRTKFRWADWTGKQTFNKMGLLEKLKHIYIFNFQFQFYNREHQCFLRHQQSTGKN